MRLILLPGMNGTAHLSRWFLEALPSGVKGSALAYPADRHLSYLEFAEHIRQALPQDEPYILVAESYSGPVAALLAAEPTGPLRAVVLVASFVRRPFGRLGAWLARPVAWLVRHAPASRWLLSWLVLWPAMRPDVETALRQLIPRLDRALLAERAAEALRSDCSAQWAACAVPAVFLVPSRDRLFRRWTLNACRAILPTMTERVIRGPHLLLQHAPREVVAVLTEMGVLG
jgi:pimeloyl-ACP methyl ester carboxylesterase